MKAAPTAVVDAAAISVIARSLAGQSRSERASRPCGVRRPGPDRRHRRRLRRLGARPWGGRRRQAH